MKRAFTLLELLTVVAILGILAGLLMPVLARAKAAAKGAVCVGNERNLHVAVTLYAGDWDDRYPRAADRYWQNVVCEEPPPFALERGFCDFPSPAATLAPYITDRDVWHCPADTGLDVLDFTQEASRQWPTSFASTGSSYWWNDDLSEESTTSVVLPSKAILLFDRAGAWHGTGRMIYVGNGPELGLLFSGFRYNALHADGHVRTLRPREVNRGLAAVYCATDCLWYQGNQEYL